MRRKPDVLHTWIQSSQDLPGVVQRLHAVTVVDHLCHTSKVRGFRAQVHLKDHGTSLVGRSWRAHKSRVPSNRGGVPALHPSPELLSGQCRALVLGSLQAAGCREVEIWAGGGLRFRVWPALPTAFSLPALPPLREGNNLCST